MSEKNNVDDKSVKLLSCFCCLKTQKNVTYQATSEKTQII